MTILGLTKRPEVYVEGGTARITAQFTKEDGSNLPLAELVSCALTLYVRGTETIINGRDHQSVLNINGGTVDVGGALAIRLGPGDMAAIQDRPREWHVALIEYSWEGGAQESAHEVVFQLRNLRHRP